ncbi:response regulator [Bacillus sp. 1NLA3E]|uniref:response regulator n=1 Tax=Bacillus sp. 1NLA3E TaxID=666686 RepID=UPI00031FB2C2|nr:response regulator receiver protein [Bacillus sp. 1NLA3E]
MIKVNKTVLIIDDSTFMRNMLKNVLSESNYLVISEASNGNDAISLYQEFNPDIVLLDITLPDINGIDVLKKLIKINSEAKIVMCSSMGQSFVIIEALELGAKDFIVKPNFNELIPALNKVFNLPIKIC